MSLGKKDIIKSISSETLLPRSTSKALLESFLCILKANKFKKIKISKFGSFYTYETPERIGRNPNTKEEFIITSRKKLIFKPSSFIKINLNYNYGRDGRI